MKRLLIAICTLLGSMLLPSCGVTIEVENELDFAREGEVIEIEWQELRGEALSPENVVVYALDGSQCPSQVVFDGDGKPTALLIAVTVEANSSMSNSNEY